MVQDWRPVSTVPPDRPVQLGVIDANGTHPLKFPCRRTQTRWVNAATGSPISIEPTHWREWTSGAAATAEAATLMRINQMLIGAELPSLYEGFLEQQPPPELCKLLDELAERELQQIAAADTDKSPQS